MEGPDAETVPSRDRPEWISEMSECCFTFKRTSPFRVSRVIWVKGEFQLMGLLIRTLLHVGCPVQGSYKKDVDVG